MPLVGPHFNSFNVDFDSDSDFNSSLFSRVSSCFASYLEIYQQFVVCCSSQIGATLKGKNLLTAS